jgi:hypothetical protein
VLFGGILNIGLAALLARPYLQMGMCSAVISSEAFVALACLAYVHHRRVNPFSSMDQAGLETRMLRPEAVR